MNKLNELESSILTEASRGFIVPTKSKVEAFKSLITKKLIEHKGNNRYKISKTGLQLLMDGTNIAPTSTELKGSQEKPLPVQKKVVSQTKQLPSRIKKTNEELDAIYTKKYKHYVPKSIKSTLQGKKRAKIKCTISNCANTREVFTADIFQVKLCEQHKKEKSQAKLTRLAKSKVHAHK